MNIGFVSFAGGDFLWRASLRRIHRQALGSKAFITTRIYSPEDLRNLTTPHEYDFIRINPRGFGYWIWKPLIVSNFLNQNPEIEKILYADAGCDLNFNSDSNVTWARYMKALESHEAIVFKMELIERHWTKHEVFNSLPEMEKFRDSEQILGGVFLMTRDFALKFCNRWIETMREKSYSLVTDEFDPKIQDSDFVHPRHDQSIFSLLVKQESNILVLDSLQELYFEPDWDRGKNQPIWTSRNKSGVPKYNLTLPARIVRLIERVIRRLFI
jgi:hypothetical protein